ncbi:MAG: DapH/DapD/GlmU-related protein [Pseudomonadota bacterium]
MLSLRRWIANTLAGLSPPTRAFAWRRTLWRLAGVDVGARAKILSSVRIWTSGPVEIGPDTFIGHEVLIVGGTAPIKIGARCDLAPRVCLASGTHDEGNGERAAGKGRSEPINVGDGVWIGAGSTVTAGATIGRSSIVGAGSLVRGEIPGDVVVAGVPARMIRARDYALEQVDAS